MGVAERLRHWTRSTPAPVLWPDGADLCPKCHRPLAGAIAPRRVGPAPIPSMAQMRTREETILICPVDGPLGRTHGVHALDLAAVRAVSTELASNLRRARDKGWAKYFEKANDCADNDEFLKWFGHALAVLLRRGPIADLTADRAALESTLVSVVASWPPKAPSP